MSEKMLKFVNIDMQMPAKKTSDVRTEDFKEIYSRFVHDKAKEQSSRCSQCGVPFCQIHCPLHNNIPDWLKLTAEGRLQEAHELVHSTNNMPEICGSICPQDRLCEGNCVIERAGHGTVTIGSVEKYITDTAWEKGWIKPIKVLREINQSVGIIGAGPAGLACAEELRKSGYKITIYDRYDRPGGLLIYGIPNFKLEKFSVERRTNLLKESGIKFKQDFEIGKDISLDELRKNWGVRTDAIWHEAFVKMSLVERSYMTAALRLGEKITKQPRIILSTIHSAKGGEADNVILFSDVAQRTFKDMQKFPDNERRVFYVGTTRTRNNLNIIVSKTKFSFSEI